MHLHSQSVSASVRVGGIAGVLLAGQFSAAATGICLGDLNVDSQVDGADLSMLLSSWGPCSRPSPCAVDLDGDGTVGGSDLALLLAAWGECPPATAESGWTDLPSLLATDSRIVYLATNEADTVVASTRVPAWRVSGAAIDNSPNSTLEDPVLYPADAPLISEQLGLGHTTGPGPLAPTVSQQSAEEILDQLGVSVPPASLAFLSWKHSPTQHGSLAIAVRAGDAPLVLQIFGILMHRGSLGLHSTHEVAYLGNSLMRVDTTLASGDLLLIIGAGYEFEGAANLYLAYTSSPLTVRYLSHTPDGYEEIWSGLANEACSLNWGVYDLVPVPVLNQHGRGYYLPSDPEIGPDPTRPIGPIVAHKEPLGALKALGAGRAIAPDWLLYKRGDEFDTSLIDASVAYQGGPGDLGDLLRFGYADTLQGFHESAGLRSGLSPDAPFVVSAWGDLSLARPKIAGGFRKPLSLHNCVITSLDFSGRGNALSLFEGFWSQSGEHHRNVLIEDCVLSSGAASNVGLGGPVTLRRCIVEGAWNQGAHVQGMFVATYGDEDTSFTFEECIFDMNGYKENPLDPSSWTSGVVSTGSAGAMPVGTGVQPTRTYFDRNIYVTTGNGVNHLRFVLRGSIVSRGGGGGSVQMRQGGVSERNVFMWNEDAGYASNGPGAVFARNLVLHDDHMRPPGGWGKGLTVFNSESWNNEGYGWSLDPDPQYIVDDSIFAHFHRGSNGGGMLDIYNASTEHYANGSNYGTLLNGRVSITNNALYRSQAEALRFVSYGTWDDAIIGGNRIAMASGTLFSSGAVHLTSVAEKGSVPYSIGDAFSGGNLYWSQSATPFGGNRTFSQWQALRSGFESESQFYSDFAAFRAAAGWTAPERDIVSYMQSIDPTYIPNEDVTTDDGVPADKRRPDAQLVRQVMQSTGMSDAQARLTARRYHAFLVFIERAKANRKGAWDPDYTADALNNYIREGFGKTPVGGPYTATYPGTTP